MKIDVLDHGFVRLVSFMQPAAQGVNEDANRMDPPRWTGDLEIVRNARVSYNADWRSEREEAAEDKPYRADKDERLIHYLWKNQHTSPFEAMVFTFEVQAPMFIFRQWHRHRTWSYNEVSARYTELPELFYVPAPEHVGRQSKDNKQARTIGEALQESFELSYWATNERMGSFPEAVRIHSQEAFKLYKYCLSVGVPRELARSLLPMNTYSRMFATVDLRNLFHFLKLRLHEHAQYEIRVYAEALLQLVRPICPIAVAAFEESIGL